MFLPLDSDSLVRYKDTLGEVLWLRGIVLMLMVGASSPSALLLDVIGRFSTTRMTVVPYPIHERPNATAGKPYHSYIDVRRLNVSVSLVLAHHQSCKIDSSSGHDSHCSDSRCWSQDM